MANDRTAADLTNANLDPRATDPAIWNGATPHVDQARAVDMALREKTMALAGYAGTGKTFTLSAIIKALGTDRVLICAPTGKAAQQATRSTGFEAMTIHRAVALDAATEGTKFDSPFTIVDLVIVDECSMVDSLLMSRLLQAIGPDVRVIFVGDPGQLPPVSSGSPYRDMLTSGLVPSVTLTKVQRQKGSSPIPVVAESVRQGENPKWARECNWVPFNSDKITARQAVQEYVSCTTPAADGSVAHTPGETIAMVAPQRSGDAGTYAINRAIQKALLPMERDLCSGGANYQLRLGDVVVNTKNDMDLGIVNGDVGRIIAGTANDAGMPLPEGALGPAMCRVVVEFKSEGETRVVGFCSNKARMLQLAYCMTCHKMQGSQAQYVIVLVPQSSAVMTRAWLYTAITRGQSRVVVTGAAGAFRHALGLVPESNRRTMLPRVYADMVAEKAAKDATADA